MAEQRKLQLLLPKGWLIRPDRWNVSHLLKLAGIGEYYKEGKSTYFKSDDPEIKAIVAKARDIPMLLSRSIFGLGITGEDIIQESILAEEESSKNSHMSDKVRIYYEMGKKDSPDNSIKNIQEDFDLRCGYVDLAFITTSENLKRFSEYKDKPNEGDKSPKIILPPGFSDNKFPLLDQFVEYLRRNELIGNICLTKYPKIASKFIGNRDTYSHLRPSAFFVHDPLKIEYCHGSTEELLNRGFADFILETVATGDSINRRNLVIIEKIMNSTARFCNYSEKDLNKFGKIFGAEQETGWAINKSNEIKGKLEHVLWEIDNHCQARLTFNHPPHRTMAYLGLKSWDNLSGKLVSKSSKPNIYRDLDTIDFVFDKHNLPDFIRFYEEFYSSRFIDITKKMKIRDGRIVCPSNFFNKGYIICELKVFDLKSLYAYCPIMEFYRPRIEEPDGFYGKYPPCDSSKLRPEHQKDAIIFESKSGENLHK